MKYIFSILFLVLIFCSCGPKVEKSHHSIYFIKNNNGTKIKVEVKLASTKADLFCSTCFIEPNEELQIASNITSSGAVDPNETIDKILIYRNDSLKITIEDSSLLNLPWNITKLGEYHTDYQYIVNSF